MAIAISQPVQMLIRKTEVEDNYKHSIENCRLEQKMIRITAVQVRLVSHAFTNAYVSSSHFLV
jgi:hypothetical protein